jgi:hypothetical protein
VHGESEREILTTTRYTRTTNPCMNISASRIALTCWETRAGSGTFRFLLWYLSQRVHEVDAWGEHVVELHELDECAARVIGPRRTSLSSRHPASSR